MENTRERHAKTALLAALAAIAAFALCFALAGCSGSSSESSGAAGSSSDGDAAATQAAASGDKTTVKIAYLPITHALPVFEEADELAASGDSSIQIELVQYGSWPELMDALNSGQVDGASVLVELAMRSAEQGVDLRAVALGHHDGNVIVSSDAVQSVNDLAGKTIAIPARQSSHYILVREALDEAGLSEDDVYITELAPTEMPSALASGQIDAFCVAEPFGARAVEVGAGHVLKNSEELWQDSVCCALVLNGGFIDDNPDAAKELATAYEKAGDDLEQEGEAKRVASEHLDQSDDVLDISLQWISYDDLALDEDTYNALAERVEEYGLSENPPSYDEFVTDLAS